MSNKFYQPGEQRAARVCDLFSRIAPRYDLINDLQSFGLHRFWKRRLIHFARIQRRSRVLDLCCGTGDVALEFARRGTETVGLDFSEPMLAVAQTRSRKEGLAIEFIQGDALHLPFAADQFDAVTVSYGLRNLADVEGGLREMYRVAKPGGRLVVLDFGKPRQPILRAAYFAYLRHWVPWFGRLLCGDSATYAYILESLIHYPAQEGIAAYMRNLGCQNTGISNLLGGVMSINFGEKQRALR